MIYLVVEINEYGINKIIEAYHHKDEADLAADNRNSKEQKYYEVLSVNQAGSLD